MAAWLPSSVTHMARGQPLLWHWLEHTPHPGMCRSLCVPACPHQEISLRTLCLAWSGCAGPSPAHSLFQQLILSSNTSAWGGQCAWADPAEATGPARLCLQGRPDCVSGLGLSQPDTSQLVVLEFPV